MTDEALNLELEAQIAAEPYNTVLRRVYADWLIEAGNPRGELAALQLAGHAAAKAVLEEHAEQLLGPNTGLRDFTDRIVWNAGFWDELGISGPLDQFGVHPSARLVRTLHVNEYGPAFEPCIELLAAGRWPALRTLRIGLRRDIQGADVVEEGERTCSNLALLVPVMPRLEHLTILCGSFRFANFASLQTFTCDGLNLTSASLRSLFAARLPALAELQLLIAYNWGHQPDITAAEFERLFSGDLFPALREARLYVITDSWDDSLFEEIEAAATASPLARRASIVVAYEYDPEP